MSTNTIMYYGFILVWWIGVVLLLRVDTRVLMVLAIMIAIREFVNDWYNDSKKKDGKN